MSRRESLRRVWEIAYAESRRTGGSFNRKTSVALLAIGLVGAFLVPPLMDQGLDFDRGLYRVAVTEDSPLLPAIQQSRLFRIVGGDPRGAVESGEADIGATGTSLIVPSTDKGEAAAAAMKQAAKDYTYSQLAREPDQSAAFPVRVELLYVEQPRDPSQGGGGGVPVLPSPTTPTAGAPGAGSVTGGGASGGGGSGPGAPPGSGSTEGFSFLPPERSVNTPETLSPPFPFRSLLLAYAFLIPMNFVVQVYAGSAISERLDRKGEPLLASPARPWEIIVGKALPYFALMMLVSLGIVIAIGGGWLSLLAVMPIALAFLGMEFIAAMYARSFRELTFLTVFTSVLLTIYAFLPAVFSDVHPVALVSPITLVVFDLRDQSVPLFQLLYSLAPLTLFSLVLFLLGAALYREEDLFHQKPVFAKAVDSVARQVRGLPSALLVPVLMMPLVLVAELLLITFLYAWPVPVGTMGILLAVALVEETFKAAPSYAGARRGLLAPGRAWIFGMLVGVGFWLGEKGFLLASLAGLGDVEAGAAVFGTAGVSPVGMPLALALLLLLAPLALHVVTAGITGWGAGKREKGVFGASFLLAVALHATYNLAVIVWMGGGAL